MRIDPARPKLHARERLPALLRTTLLLSQVRGEQRKQKELDMRIRERTTDVDKMEYDDKGRMVVKKEASGVKKEASGKRGCGTQRLDKRASFSPTSISGPESGEHSEAGKAVAAEGSKGADVFDSPIRRNASAFDVTEDTLKREKTVRERAPSTRRVKIQTTPPSIYADPRSSAAEMGAARLPLSAAFAVSAAADAETAAADAGAGVGTGARVSTESSASINRRRSCLRNKKKIQANPRKKVARELRRRVPNTSTKNT